MRTHGKALLLAAVLTISAAATACGPATDAAPDGYRADECGLSDQIQAAFADTPDAHSMVDIAIRESRCDPCAYYPSQSFCGGLPGTAKGAFQLLGHDDLLAQVCLGGAWVWYDPYCNIAAARLLYDGAGRAPWGG